MWTTPFIASCHNMPSLLIDLHGFVVWNFLIGAIVWVQKMDKDCPRLLTIMWSLPHNSIIFQKTNSFIPLAQIHQLYYFSELHTFINIIFYSSGAKTFQWRYMLTHTSNKPWIHKFWYEATLGFFYVSDSELQCP